MFETHLNAVDLKRLQHIIHTASTADVEHVLNKQHCSPEDFPVLISSAAADYIETMAATEVLDQFLPQDQTGEYVRDIDRWPRWLHPVLRYYEVTCLSLVEWLWNRSLVQWMIKH